jgi:hypothetical protein
MVTIWCYGRDLALGQQSGRRPAGIAPAMVFGFRGASQSVQINKTGSGMMFAAPVYVL